ncbi:TniQ family protein [Petrachloros mirabilis]
MPFLLPLAVRGAGTVDIECIGAHIQRLSVTHGVSAARLLEDSFRWYGISNRAARAHLPAFKANGGLAVYARPNATSKAILEVLTAATGRPELRSTTFLPVADALHRSSRTFSPQLRWCSACMDEFRVTGDPGYFKLSWLLLDITHCPVHGVALVDRCPHCHSHQGGLGYKTDCRRCQSCGEELGRLPDNRSLAPSWDHPAGDLIDLVALIANDHSLHFPADGVRAVVSHLFDSAWASQDELRLWKRLPQHECINLANGEMPISLLVARRVAYQLDMRLTDLLAGDIGAASHVLDPSWTGTLPKALAPRSRGPARSRKKVLKTVVDLLNEYGTSNPPPLRTVAEKVGVSVGYLAHHFPVVARDVTQRHREWLAQAMEAKHQKARLEAFSYFQRIGYSEEHYSRKNALRVIRKRTGLPKNLLRDEINLVYRQLFKN